MPLPVPCCSFVPRGLHDYLAHVAACSQEDAPFGAVKFGSVLFCDASGFTKLTVRAGR